MFARPGETLLQRGGRRVAVSLPTLPPALANYAISSAISQPEGNSGATAFIYTVTRSVRTDIASSIAWATTGSGANPAAAGDFVGGVLPSGAVGFAIGETTKTFTVSVAGDATIEPDEAFTVTISAPDPAGTISVASAMGTILNDDAPAPVTAILMGQSEMEYLVNTDSFYRQIPQPVPGNGNLIVFTQAGNGAAPVRTVVNSSSVAAGQVNPAMAAMSAFLNFARPGRQFVLGDGAVQGTGRYSLADETTNASDDRLFADFASVASAIEGEFGSVGSLIECWYNADASSINDFVNNFWPFYFGMTGAGGAFTLGSVHNGRQIDRCLYDGAAATSAKGRGIFRRDTTKWRVITPMPFLDAPIDPAPELLNFSAGNDRLIEPARAVMHTLPANALAQSVSVEVGPSAHVCRFGGTISSQIHPDVATRDGQVLLMWPVALAMLRASGMTIGEPQIVDIEGQSDGTYADLVIDLPNGGNLTTLAALRGTTYSGSAPHQQAVTGVELSRAGGQRRPVHRTTSTSYPASSRGTVAIVDAGSGAPRRGRVRVTPTTPFVFGDSLSYLRGQAIANLLEPRDFDLFPWFLVEHVPSLFDASATYPFEGVAVRPFQQEIAVPVAAPAFSARGTNFNGSARYNGSGLVVPAGSSGIFSGWFRHTGPTWTTARTIFEARVGTTAVIAITTTSSQRLTFRVSQDGTGSDTFTTASGALAVDQWYHVLWAWDYASARFQIYINGVALNTAAYSFTGSTKFTHAGDTITQFAVGALTGGTGLWVGDFAHMFLDVTASLDLSVAANREKFALAGQPVDLGPTGALPLGTTPEWYYDGTAPAWANVGTAGNVTLTGTLAASSTPPGY